MSESKKILAHNNIHSEHKAPSIRVRDICTLSLSSGRTQRERTHVMRTISTRRTSSLITRAGLPAAAIAIVLSMADCGSSSSSSGTPAATLQKALAELNAGNFNDAKKDFQAVLDKDPQNKSGLAKYAHYNLGYIAQTQGSRADAETEYRLALTEDPKFGSALYNLAIAVTADGDATSAISLYRRAIASNNQDANSHFNLGLLLRQSGNKAAGNAQIQEAVRLNPTLAASARAQ